MLNDRQVLWHVCCGVGSRGIFRDRQGVNVTCPAT
jgi:hypothetical protein